jgi:hypothetical protein
MKTTKKLLPVQPGTKRLADQYGEDLVCVRYRHEPEEDMVVKTMELLIGRTPRRAAKSRISTNKLVNVRVEFGETGLGRRKGSYRHF